MDEWMMMNGWILQWMDGSLARTTKKTKKIASCETFCRLSNHNIVRTFTLSKMNVRKSAIRAMNRCLSVAIPLGAILLLASAQGGTFHRPVRAILFQFHLLLPRPDWGTEFPVGFFVRGLPALTRQTNSRSPRKNGARPRPSVPIPYTLHRAVPAAFLLALSRRSHPKRRPHRSRRGHRGGGACFPGPPEA
jgi:hypothetical protein